jgi:hypothetical protein
VKNLSFVCEFRLASFFRAEYLLFSLQIVGCLSFECWKTV